MTSQRLLRVVHKNDLNAYLGNWKNMMTMMDRMKLEESQHYPIRRLPAPFESFALNTHDLNVLLAYLDKNLTILEETPLSQFNDQAYAEARVFLKTSFILFPVTLDDLSGIIEYFYKNNEPKVEVKKKFSDLLVKSKNGRLPQDLSKLTEQTSSWFPEMKRTRNDLIHHYDSILVSFKELESGRNVIGHFHIGGREPYAYEDTRSFLGHVLRQYQELIDGLLDHFDNKFINWYKFKPQRNLNILEGLAGIMLWWAYKYGNYKHEDLQVIEGNNTVAN